MIKATHSLLFPLVLAFYEISTYLSNDMYLPALPAMMRDLSLSTKQIQFTLTTWFLGLASFPLIMGILSDLWGRRTILLSGGIIYIIATCCCALTHSHSLLLLARFVEGAMTASMMVAGYAVVHELYQHKEAVRVLALMGAISVLAPTLGPLLGSLVLLFASWRMIFWLIAFSASIAILILFKVMPETNNTTTKNQLDIQQLLHAYWTILSNARFMGLMTILGCIFAGFICWITAGSLLVINTFHSSALAFGAIQLIIFIAYIIGNRLVNQLLLQFSIFQLVHKGLNISLVGCFIMLLMSLFSAHYLYGFIVGMIVFSFGTALCFAPLNRLIIESSNEKMGIRVALFTVFLTGFSTLGSAASGIFFNGSLLSLIILIKFFIIISYVISIILQHYYDFQ